MRVLRIILFISIVLIFSHSVFPQGSNIDGSWVKVMPDTQLGGFSFKFTFSGDNFFMRRGVYVDYIDSKDTCRKNRGWVDFSAGKLQIDEGKITLNGLWTDSSYTNEQVFGCTDLGEFKESYYYKLNNDTLMFNKNEAVFDESKKYPHIYDMLVLVRSEK